LAKVINFCRCSLVGVLFQGIDCLSNCNPCAKSTCYLSHRSEPHELWNSDDKSRHRTQPPRGSPRAETETLRERINSGLAEARRKGVTLGRPKGSGITTRAFLGKHRDVAKLLRDGQSIRNVAKITGKGISTVQRVKAVG